MTFSVSRQAALAFGALLAIAGQAQIATAQQVPALYDGKDTTYQIIPGSNLPW